MAGTDDDIEYAKRRVDELMKIRASRPWNKVSLRDEIMEFVGELPTDMSASWRNSLRHKMIGLCDVAEQIAYRVVYWRHQPPLDQEAKDIVDSLLKEGKINRDEWGRAVWQRILRRADDGVLESVGPRPIAFTVGKVGIFLLIVIVSSFITIMFTEPFNFQIVFPLAIYIGLLAGIFGRLLYQAAWGQHDLAKRIKFYFPHRNIRLKISER